MTFGSNSKQNKTKKRTTKKLTSEKDSATDSDFEREESPQKSNKT